MASSAESVPLLWRLSCIPLFKLLGPVWCRNVEPGGVTDFVQPVDVVTDYVPSGVEVDYDDISDNEVFYDDISGDEVNYDDISDNEGIYDDISGDEVNYDDISGDVVDFDDISDDEVDFDDVSDNEVNSPVMIERMCTLSYYHQQTGSMNH